MYQVSTCSVLPPLRSALGEYVPSSSFLCCGLSALQEMTWCAPWGSQMPCPVSSTWLPNKALATPHQQLGFRMAWKRLWDLSCCLWNWLTKASLNQTAPSSFTAVQHITQHCRNDEGFKLEVPLQLFHKLISVRFWVYLSSYNLTSPMEGEGLFFKMLCCFL